MKLFNKAFVTVFVAFFVLFLTSPAAFGLNFQLTDYNVIADGTVDAREWENADFEADFFGEDSGAMYAMWKEGYMAGDGNYDGIFSFLLHNIEQLPTEEDYDYNVFDIFNTDDELTLTLFVFNDIDNDAATDSLWLERAGLGGDYSEMDDRGFLVYNYALDEYRQWLPEGNRPEDGDYDWDYYWGVYGRGGFDNSAFTQGLPLAKDGDNELYEVIYRSEDKAKVKRSIKDPDQNDDLVIYWEGELEYVPEPLGVVMFGFGMGAILALRRKFNK